MKAVTATLMVGALGLSAISCSVAEKTPETVKTTQAPAKTKTDVFVETMKTQYPSSSRSEIISLGQTACDAIRSFGSVLDTFLAIAEDDSWSTEEAGDAGFTFGAAVPAFCPEFQAEMDDLAK
jgi:hypothetical protein